MVLPGVVSLLSTQSSFNVHFVLIPECSLCGAGPECFSGSAVVLTRSGPKPLAAIHFGEDVQTMQGSTIGFSPVLLFASREVTAQYEYHDITLSSGHQIQASGSHFLPVGGRTFANARMVPAADVAIGNRLWVISSGNVEDAIAVSTELVNKTGAVNFHMGSSALIVDGVAAYEFTTHSVYTSVSMYKLVHLPLRALIRLLPGHLAFHVISLLQDTADATFRLFFASVSPGIVGVIWPSLMAFASV